MLERSRSDPLESHKSDAEVRKVDHAVQQQPNKVHLDVTHEELPRVPVIHPAHLATLGRLDRGATHGATTHGAALLKATLEGAALAAATALARATPAALA